MSYSYASNSNAERFPGPDPYAPLGSHPEFPVTSTDLDDGAAISPAQAAPSNTSPQLAWSDLPEGTRSLAVTCFDPDAPTGSGFWHWAVFNIPASVTALPTGAGETPGLEVLADAAGDAAARIVSLRGDSGQRTYYGPQPPQGHGPHRYLFAVHALDVDELDIDPDASPATLGFNLYFHTLGRGVLWGWFETT